MERMDTVDRSTRSVDTEPISETVLRAVAERTGCSPLELPLLYESIDPEALNALVASTEDSPVGGSVVVEFEYAGFLVRIVGSETVELRSVETSAQAVAEATQAG